jgi:hypothetical protein
MQRAIPNLRYFPANWMIVRISPGVLSCRERLQGAAAGLHDPVCPGCFSPPAAAIGPSGRNDRRIPLACTPNSLPLC